MAEKFEIVEGLFHGFDYTPYLSGSGAAKSTVLKGGLEHILALRDGKSRLLKSVIELSAGFALAVPHEEALKIRGRVAYFQAVRAVMVKGTPGRALAHEELNQAVRQLVTRALTPEGVVDIFTAAGLAKPDISILSDEFLAEVRDLPQRSLAVELLQRLLDDAIRTRSKSNLVQARSFSEMLGRAVLKYQNRAIETAQVIEELIALAKEIRAARDRGEVLGLSEDELAFWFSTVPRA